MQRWQTVLQTPVSSSRAMMRGAALTLLAALSLSACGEDATTPAATTGPTVDRDLQDPLPLACDAKTTVCWESELAAHPSLQTLVQAAGLEVQAAGKLRDKAGNSLLWAELAASPFASRTEVQAAFVRCNAKNVCVYGKAAYTATGATFTDDKGNAIKDLAIGRPVLHKMLKAHSPDKDPTLLAPLQDTAKPDAEQVRQQLSMMARHQRRCVILNAYGPEMALDPAPVVAAAKATGRFDSVEVINYVRQLDVELLLPTLTPLDAVVWLGAGVYENRSEGKRLLGMTVSRGVFGDGLFYGKTAPDLLKVTPLGGPGLVVLAGSGTLAQGSWSDLNTLGYALKDTGRAVVGFTGNVTAAQAVSASAGLLQRLGGGATLSAAVAASGAPMIATMDKTAADKWVLTPASAKFWAKVPTKAALQLKVRLDPPSCAAAGSWDVCDRAGWVEAYGKNAVPATQLTAGHASFLCDGLQFDGPFFSCAAKDENTGADFKVEGVMRGRSEGDRFWLIADGTAGAKYKNLLVIGEAELGKSDVGGGKSTLYFDGPAAAATWIDEDDRCCTCKGLGALTTIKSEPSWIEIWP